MGAAVEQIRLRSEFSFFKDQRGTKKGIAVQSDNVDEKHLDGDEHLEDRKNCEPLIKMVPREGIEPTTHRLRVCYFILFINNL